VRLASPIGSAAGGSVNLSTSLPNVAKLAAHSKFVWVFNGNCDGTIIYNDPVEYFTAIVHNITIHRLYVCTLYVLTFSIFENMIIS
jgi:esterase/lipase superfamily enzyme